MSNDNILREEMSKFASHHEQKLISICKTFTDDKFLFMEIRIYRKGWGECYSSIRERVGYKSKEDFLFKWFDDSRFFDRRMTKLVFKGFNVLKRHDASIYLRNNLLCTDNTSEITYSDKEIEIDFEAMLKEVI